MLRSAGVWACARRSLTCHPARYTGESAARLPTTTTRSGADGVARTRVDARRQGPPGLPRSAGPAQDPQFSPWIISALTYLVCRRPGSSTFSAAEATPEEIADTVQCVAGAAGVCTGPPRPRGYLCHHDLTGETYAVDPDWTWDLRTAIPSLLLVVTMPNPSLKRLAKAMEKRGFVVEPPTDRRRQGHSPARPPASAVIDCGGRIARPRRVGTLRERRPGQPDRGLPGYGRHRHRPWGRCRWGATELLSNPRTPRP